MRTMDRVDTIKWLSSRGLSDDEGRCLAAFDKRRVHWIPVDSGAKTTVARDLARQFAGSEETLLWIDEFGIWPSAENRHLFDSFRHSLVEDKPLYERPGHILVPADADTLFSLLCMVLYFVWGAVLTVSSGEAMVRISHDEWIELYVRDSSELGIALFDALKDCE